MLEPFGNRLTIARDIQQALASAGSDKFGAIILWARDADTVAAAGASSPILALVPPGERRAPAGASQILAWPAQAASLHAALRSLEDRNAPHVQEDEPEPSTVALDAMAMAALEKSVGLKTLIEILQAYVQTAEGLCRSLQQASERDDWEEAARAAQDIAGSAGALGLAAMTAAARGFASAAREGESPEQLRGRARTLVQEHLVVQRALKNIYPDIAA
jgi:HPt (histidine-containing phosphotransfer) domain-containing protein